MKKNFNLILQILFINFICTGISLSDFQKKLVDKLETTKTLSFNFRQTIAEREEIGKCYIKYPLLMKCDYEGFKKKSIISNGRTVAIIKKKYKKIYYYPIKTTPLFTILKKNKF